MSEDGLAGPTCMQKLYFLSQALVNVHHLCSEKPNVTPFALPSFLFQRIVLAEGLVGMACWAGSFGFVFFFCFVFSFCASFIIGGLKRKKNEKEDYVVPFGFLSLIHKQFLT